MEVFQTILISVDTLIRWFKHLHGLFTYQCCFPSLSVLFPQHRYTCRKPVQHIKPKGGTYASDKQPVTSLLCFRIVPLQFTICFMFLWNCFGKTGINLMHILLKLFAVGHDKNMKYSRHWSAELPMVFRQPKIKHVELWIPWISWFPGPRFMSEWKVFYTIQPFLRLYDRYIIKLFPCSHCVQTIKFSVQLIL